MKREICEICPCRMAVSVERMMLLDGSDYYNEYGIGCLDTKEAHTLFYKVLDAQICKKILREIQCGVRDPKQLSCLSEIETPKECYYFFEQQITEIKNETTNM